MTFGIVVFPGSNCDHDCYDVLSRVLGQNVDLVWHKTTSLDGIDAVILPGGFSYGDYLRAGAIARCSPIMRAVADFAERGGLVLGICNGFQILLEMGLLPGAMIRNTALHFVCRDVHIRAENTETPFTNRCATGQVLTIPIAHGEGNYFADDATLALLHEHRQVVFRYTSAHGELASEYNPNGSRDHIAGICNRERNVLGMMPHPERCADAILGNEDGKILFASMIDALTTVA
ncbi:MAG TPA: phosphoribosylformylglycinamidine synthase subunit PurQ [Nitrospirales bacterium]|nr:phosphoribosylformylglycinamidine synthase subunit PurQ [Nitrospirales bacterium]HIO70124.1 phosphoribosylformylglycinamidine synthase subunit PurQ [Nitrospirales bacterium]